MSFFSGKYKLKELFSMAGWKSEELPEDISYIFFEEGWDPKVVIEAPDTKDFSIKWRCYIDHHKTSFIHKQNESVTLGVTKETSWTVSQNIVSIKAVKTDDIWGVESVIFHDMAKGAESKEELLEKAFEFLRSAHVDIANGKMPTSDMILSNGMGVKEEGGTRYAFPMDDPHGLLR